MEIAEPTGGQEDDSDQPKEEVDADESSENMSRSKESQRPSITDLDLPTINGREVPQAGDPQDPPEDSDDDSMDKKPAAKDDNDESDSEDSDSMSGSEDESDGEDSTLGADPSGASSSQPDNSTDLTENKSEASAYLDEEGRQLSEYEIQRLERIKRNRELLAQLGLQGKGGGGVLGDKKKETGRPRKSERPKSEQVVVERRKTISRQSKLNRKSYKEPSKSLKSIYEDAEGGTKPKKTAPKQKDEVKKKHRSHRMSHDVYIEFQHVQAEKRNILKQAQKNVRHAAKEVKYWKKRISVAKQPSRRRDDLRDKKVLGGRTAREFVQLIDERMPEIRQTIEEYENAMTAGQKEKEREHAKIVAEAKIKTLDALDRFPKAMKAATSLLNSVLVERVPKDPPPPRRSKRSVGGDEEEDSKPAPSEKKPSGRKKKKQAPEQTIDQPPIVDDTTLEPSSADKGDGTPDRTAKNRSRVARNVGGWVSPQFSEMVDRSWLENSSRKNGIIDLSSYVPQPGETVLYYVAGHKKYLEQYPDFLAKKTRTKSRVPLWERVIKPKKVKGTKRVSSGNTETVEAGTTERWWSEEWQNGEFDHYPVLCRVLRAHAEFPPDPWSKIVQKKGEQDTTKLYFKKPKASGDQQAADRVPVRLAVELRPLLPLVPISNLGSTGEPEPMHLPPIITAVTFPCAELQPFIIPFLWAYSRTHSLALDQKVYVANGSEESKVRIDSFASIEGHNVQQLGGKETEIRIVLEKYSGKDQARYETLDREVGKTRFPLRDARAVLDMWRNRLSDAQVAEQQKGKLGFFDLLRSTLPLWNGATIMKSMWDRRKMTYSPWRLFVAPRKKGVVDQWRLGEFCPSLDERLASKLNCFLSDLVSDNASASGLFLGPITEEVAPSYYCAVPIGMCLSKVQDRLKPDPSAKSFYRTVEALQLDVSSLLECCLLYNSPDSDVVAEALNLVATIRDAVTQITQDHNREVNEALKVDEERRRLLRGHSQPTSAEFNSGSLIPGCFDIRNPIKGQAESAWLEKTHQQAGNLVFQAGDDVRYSRSLHQAFVEGHYRSLDSFQCALPPLSKAGEADGPLNANWASGRVIWTRSVFPKSPHRLSADDAYTFPSSTTLQCLGVRFEDSEPVFPIYWRPCFSSECPDDEGVCEKCSVPFTTSFIVCTSDKPGTTKPPIDESIGPILRLVKDRCMSKSSPSAVDPEVTVSSVQAGYLPPPPNMKNIPSFPEVFGDHGTEDESLARRSNQKSVSRQSAHTSRDGFPDFTNLIYSGFLPEWLSTSGADAGYEIPKAVKSIFPSPKLCLELISLRIEKQYYRQKEAIENDLLESYIMAVVMILLPVATRKKSPISIKRITRFLGSKTPITAISEEESMWLTRLRYVRELFLVSLVSVSDTSQVQRIMGLSPPLPPRPAEIRIHDHDPGRIAAWEKLSRLVEALSKDKCTNGFMSPSIEGCLPVFKLSMRTGGKLLTLDRDVVDATRIPFVSLDGEARSLAVVLRGNRVAFRHLETSSQTGPRKAAVDAPSILLSGENYEGSESLSRLLFQRPNRMRPCVRCRSYRRSMLVCRVNRKHSNRDYDWVGDFGGGEEYLDGLLNCLNRRDATKTTPIPLPAPTILEEADPSPEVDAAECVKQAESLLEVSNRVLERAQLFSETPNRLTKECIARTFPIDKDDGHFLYCVICGLSGDLLCCDGCPNVVHVNCVGLSVTPEEDWFCEECQDKKLSAVPDTQGKVKLPFGRAEFDHEADLLAATQTIEQLQLLRPTQRVRTKDKLPDGDVSSTRVENRPSVDTIHSDEEVQSTGNEPTDSKGVSSSASEGLGKRQSKRRHVVSSSVSEGLVKRQSKKRRVVPSSSDGRKTRKQEEELGVKSSRTRGRPRQKEKAEIAVEAPPTPSTDNESKRSTRSRSRTKFYHPDSDGHNQNGKHSTPNRKSPKKVKTPQTKETNRETEGIRRSKRTVKKRRRDSFSP